MMNLRGLYGAVPLAHFFLKERLRPGDFAVDATCGNGQDTLLLADLVGHSGRVWAFDIQETALARTAERLAAAGMESRVQLLSAGHERLAEFVTEPLQAVIFNLGYLPAGDREIKTAAATTLAALQQAATLLLPGGFILIAVYTGHTGGEEEWRAVQEWCAALLPSAFNVWQSRQLNRGETAPFLVVVERVPQRPSPPVREGSRCHLTGIPNSAMVRGNLCSLPGKPSLSGSLPDCEDNP